MKRKYLFLMTTSEMAGGQRLQLDYFRFIDYEKYSVTFALSDDIFSSVLQKEELPVEVVHLPLLSPEDSFLKKFVKYYKYLRKIKPEVVVFNQFSLESFKLPELFAAFIITKGNVYMMIHSFPESSKKERISQRLLAYLPKYSITVSKALRESLIKNQKFPKRKVKYSHHGIDINKFTPSKESRSRVRKDLGILDSDTLIVSTARFSPRKNLDRLVSAFNDLAQERDDVQLLFVGAGRKYAEIVELVDSLEEGIKSRVKFLGFQEDVASVLQACDIFVLPSDFEGLSLACLEAMACGLICVVTNSGGPLDIINDGQNGFIVSRSAQGVLNGLKAVFNLSEKEWNAISMNARACVADNFDLKNNIQSGLRLLGIEGC
ncbi:glycosyltransferase [Candidatus Omnitrophota bacterium]